jgi:hypothetical protein
MGLRIAPRKYLLFQNHGGNQDPHRVVKLVKEEVKEMLSI